MVYVTTLLAALIGVVGTVVAPYVSQRSALRSRQQEFDLARAQRDEEYERAQRNAEREQRRACYVALNIAVRRYRASINDLLYALRQGHVDDGIRTELEDARRLYIERHAEAQMTVPDEVLEAAGVVRGHLGNWFSMAMRLDAGGQGEGESLDAAFAYSEKFWKHNGHMRSVMRADLGIRDSADELESGLGSGAQ